MAKPLARLTPNKCIFLICDVQERFRTAIHGFNNVVVGSRRMLAASKELKIPTIVTEQYPKGLLKTVEELDLTGENAHAEVFEKTCFTMLCPDVKERLAALDFTDVIIMGIEAHVCVQQTTLDLIEQGRNVHLCVDAVSSSTPTDRACGLHRAECATRPCPAGPAFPGLPKRRPSTPPHLKHCDPLPPVGFALTKVRTVHLQSHNCCSGLRCTTAMPWRF